MGLCSNTINVAIKESEGRRVVILTDREGVRNSKLMVMGVDSDIDEDDETCVDAVDGVNEENRDAQDGQLSAEGLEDIFQGMELD